MVKIVLLPVVWFIQEIFHSIANFNRAIKLQTALQELVI